MSVEDADASVARVRELGAMVCGEVFDVFEAGRIAVIQDPAGTVFAVWQPVMHIGSRQVNDPGCLTWNVLQARGPETVGDFYAGLFGWEMKPIEEDEKLPYVVVKNAQSSNGGIMPMTDQHGGAPSHCFAYFTVSSYEEAVARVQGLEGEVLAGPLNLPAG